MKSFAKKSLGQNFLKSESILEKITAAAEITPDDVVFEIGPGRGALTRHLVGVAKTVVALEKDDSLFSELQTIFSEAIANKKLILIHGDVMDFNPKELGQHVSGNQSYKIVANIPYNITGGIIKKFLSTKFQPSMMVLLVQKEVAERIVALDRKTGKQGKESILSIAVKVYGDPEYVMTVKAGNFVPAPKVDSAVIKMSNISRDRFTSKHHEEVFFQVLKTGFAHKRKTLMGNLKNIWEPEIIEDVFKKLDLSEKVRAEDIPLDMWEKLSTAVYHSTYGV